MVAERWKVMDTESSFVFPFLCGGIVAILLSILFHVLVEKFLPARYENKISSYLVILAFIIGGLVTFFML
jgi:predicted PurR-regulated permease PerM